MFRLHTSTVKATVCSVCRDKLANERRPLEGAWHTVNAVAVTACGLPPGLWTTGLVAPSGGRSCGGHLHTARSRGRPRRCPPRGQSLKQSLGLGARRRVPRQRRGSPLAGADTAGDRPGAKTSLGS